MSGSPFFSWQHAILKADLEPTTKLVCHTINAHMASDGSGCFPSYRLIADESGLSRSTVILHVQKAADAGYITITNRDRDNGSHSSNVYRPTMPGGGPATGLGVVRQPDQGSPAGGLGVVRQPDSHNNPSEQLNQPSPKGPQGPCAWEEDLRFMVVVEAYKAVRADRIDLKRSWETWCTEGFAERADAILAAIPILAKGEQWKKNDRQYVPRMSRYLSDRNWMVVVPNLVPATERAEHYKAQNAKRHAWFEQQRQKQWAPKG